MSFGSRLFALLLRALPEEFRAQHQEDLAALLGEYGAGRSRWARALMLVRAALDVLWVAARLRFAPGPRDAGWVDTVAQDARYCVRSLRRDWGFGLFATVIVGLGIGACATVFSVAHALFVRPLPFADPDELVWISNGEWGRGQRLSALAVQVAHLQDLRGESRSFDQVAGYSLFDFAGDHTLSAAGEPERITRLSVTQGFFELLGVVPELGRVFTTEEVQWGGPPAVLLLHGFWTRRFAADPGILGRAILIDDVPVNVVGVLPSSFDFASIFAPGSRVDYVAPFPLGVETNAQGNTLALIGRLRSGATAESARAEARTIAARPRADRRNPFVPDVTTLRERVSGGFRAAVISLVAAVGMVMAVVCANLSNLLLARGATRGRELATRVALGATRRRLIRQMLTESLLLASAGAALGLALAVLGTRALARLAPTVALLGDARLDGATIAFSVGVTVLVGLLFGLAPAVRVSGARLHENLKEGGRGGSSGRRQGRLRNALVVSEVALACVLLVGAGLLTRSLVRLMEVDLGFRPGDAIALRIDPASLAGRPIELGAPRFASRADRDAYVEEALRLARSAAGVEAVGLSDVLPTAFNRSWCVRREGVPEGEAGPDDVCPLIRAVTDGYVGALGLSLLEGRDLSPYDDAASAPVVVINEGLARRLWPGESALGRSIQVDQDPRLVVGVVRGTRYLSPEQAPEPEAFVPIRQLPVAWVNATYLVARGSGSPTETAASVGLALRELNEDLPVRDFVVIQSLIDRSLAPRRLVVLLLAAFAGFALVLAALGIFGVISYSVKQRKRELGVRMALGASADHVRGRVLLETMALAVAGVAVGLPASWLLARLMQGLLFGVTAGDWPTFATVPLLLLTVAGLAAYLPAAQAARMDPMEVLSESA